MTRLIHFLNKKQIALPDEKIISYYHFDKCPTLLLKVTDVLVNKNNLYHIDKVYQKNKGQIYSNHNAFIFLYK